MLNFPVCLRHSIDMGKIILSGFLFQSSMPKYLNLCTEGSRKESRPII